MDPIVSVVSDVHWADRALNDGSRGGDVDCINKWSPLDPTWETWASHHAVHYTLRRNPANSLTSYRIAVNEMGTELRADAVFGIAACGTPGLVHPGALDLLIDDSTGALFLLCKSGNGFTANLTVTHDEAIPAGRAVALAATLDSVEPSKRNPDIRKVFISARVTSTDPSTGRSVLHATARVLFVARAPNALMVAAHFGIGQGNLWTLFAMGGHLQAVVLPALTCAGRRRPPTTMVPTEGDPQANTPTATPSAPVPEQSSFHWSDLPDSAAEPMLEIEKQDGTPSPLRTRHSGHLFSKGGMAWHSEGVMLGAYAGAGRGTQVYLGRQTCGHPGIVHGGCLAAVLHDIGCAAASGIPVHGSIWLGTESDGYTTTLSVDYRVPVTAGRHYVVHASLEGVTVRLALRSIRPVSKAKAHADASGSTEGRLYVEATLSIGAAAVLTPSVSTGDLSCGGSGRRAHAHATVDATGMSRVWPSAMSLASKALDALAEAQAGEKRDEESHDDGEPELGEDVMPMAQAQH